MIICKTNGKLEYGVCVSWDCTNSCGGVCTQSFGNCSSQIEVFGEIPVEVVNLEMEDTAPKNNSKEGKNRPTIAPLDLVLKYDCAAYEEGIRKYYRESWRKGFKVSDMVDSCIRHIISFYYYGEDYDKDASVKVHNLAAARFCLASILNTLDTKPELDDRFFPAKKENKTDG